MGRRYVKLSLGQRRLRYASRRAAVWLAAAAVMAVAVLADRAGLFGRPSPPDRTKYHGQTFAVVRVVDGDTLDVDVADGESPHTRIRLWGVDTPETKMPNVAPQHFGEQATEFTKQATVAKTVRLELETHAQTRDRHSRLLAFVILPDGRMLNRLLIAEGCGYADPRYEHHLKSEFLRLQTRAKEARKGLWKDATKDDLPYYYRDKLKLQHK